MAFGLWSLVLDFADKMRTTSSSDLIKIVQSLLLIIFINSKQQKRIFKDQKPKTKDQIL